MSSLSFRTLFITRQVPYPPRGGASLRNWQNINNMSKYGSVAVVSISQEKPELKSIPVVDLWHHYDISQPLSDWDKLERRFWSIRPHAHPDVDFLYTKAANRELDQVMTTFKPNLVIFEEIWLYRYLKAVKSYRCQIIFDNHNVEADLFQQSYGLTKLQLPKLKSIERDFLRKADQVWVCSEDDEYLLKHLYKPLAKCHVIPNGINVADYDSVRLNQCNLPRKLNDKHRNIIFLGQYNYPPNRIAANLLIDQIYPKLKKLYPDCRLLLVGRNPNPYMIETAKQEPGIIVTGSVPDVRPYLAAASIMLVPLLKGSGTRLKILEAFAAGCPVISTAMGAKGLKANDEEHLLIRNGIEDLVAGVCQLWSDPSLSEKLARSAYDLVKAEYSWEATGQRINKAIQEINEDGS